MTSFKIVKASGATAKGREYTVYNVVDAADGYVFETFDLRRDAKIWIWERYVAELAAQTN